MSSRTFLIVCGVVLGSAGASGRPATDPIPALEIAQAHGTERLAIAVLDDTGQAGEMDDALVVLAERQGIPSVALRPSAVRRGLDQAAEDAGADTVLVVRLSTVEVSQAAIVERRVISGPASGVTLLLSPDFGEDPASADADYRRSEPMALEQMVIPIVHPTRTLRVRAALELRRVGAETAAWRLDVQHGVTELAGPREPWWPLWTQTLGMVVRDVAGVDGTVLLRRRAQT